MEPRKKKFLIGLIILVVLLVGFLLLYAAFRKKKFQPVGPVPKPEPDQPTDENEQNNDIEPNDLDNSTDSILEVYEIIRDNVPGNETFHKLVLAQAMHETGIFSSTLTKENNNLFGMRNPVIRQTTSQGDLNGYALYNSIADSVRDYALYLKAKEIPTDTDNVELFVKNLKAKAYFEDNYIRYMGAVKKHFNFLKSLIQ
jgi:hypothetical protein